MHIVQSEVFSGLLVPFSGTLFDNTEHSFNAMNQALKERAEQTNERKRIVFCLQAEKKNLIIGGEGPKKPIP